MPKAYEEIADDLRRQIQAGKWQPGERLPSEEELRRTYDRGVPTIRQALAELETEGLIDKRHGKGTFVRVPRRKVLRTNERHQWEKDRARQAEEVRAQTGVTEHDTGLTVNDLVFNARFYEVEAGEELAEAFGVPVGTALVERVYRTRYAREPAPFNLTHSYLVRDLVAGNPDLLDETKEPWPGGTQNQLHTVGIELDRIVEEVIAARPPTHEEARELGMSPGMAIIHLRKTCIDTDGRVVELSDITLPGDRTRMKFVTPLVRW
ncbi:GntR family transcriptional regulator [Streptomyces sp. 3MP-14]|uniref:GntR family transcriptional regulator n=1 Tax=Streptomyces mimosae TaxID=2586635 RepID=A0A5N6AQK1_9ACTN|nr:MULTISPECIES: GntR family transcriptional regulator [Streptomyces]KAB8171117.1 GntR family transcriptional regulator [Streptomyces mimosae]KAB8179531.1 GntR family transcriptional regulator [Streptomyces sp. 3MP-14]